MAVRMRVFGIVQGVGFRPFVKRLADACGVRGSVCNRGAYVEIIAEAEDAALARFRRGLRNEAPPRATILHVDEVTVPAAVDMDFVIVESVDARGAVFVSPDIAMCPHCERELRDPKSRHYLHPFVNCTACGPRLTILDAMPYDRARTSMRDFPMCDDCAAAYADVASRRYHAQPVCCPDCGPHVYVLYDANGASNACEDARHADGTATKPSANAAPPPAPNAHAKDLAAISRVRAVLAAGGIAAVKGLGGFHLCCDATNAEAVARLRTRKHRPTKPFAVMVRDLTMAARETVLDRGALALLSGAEKPIVLLPRRQGAGNVCRATNDAPYISDDIARTADIARAAHDIAHLADADRATHDTIHTTDTPARIAHGVAPHLSRIGIFLPYTPLHALLFALPDGLPAFDALVMTSGNPSGAPICRTDDDARASLLPLADIILSHNRAIRTRADDSVVRWDGAVSTRDNDTTGACTAASPRVDTTATTNPTTSPCDAASTDACMTQTTIPYTMLRRSRGYAPLPLLLTHSAPSCAHREILAIGGELKNTFCLAKEDRYYLSAYIGDLSDLRTGTALRETAARMMSLLAITPEAIACDLHPRYQSSAIAREIADAHGVPLLRIQHHHAHLVSCLAEHDVDAPALGIALDGAGYGTDGTIWGGEILRFDRTTCTRVAALEPFLWQGGDRAAREGWRFAISLLAESADAHNDPACHGDAAHNADGASTVASCAAHGSNATETHNVDNTAILSALNLAPAETIALHRRLLRARVQCVETTSAGRLFDAVSAVLGLCRVSTYEGEAAILLEEAASRGTARYTGELLAACTGADGSTWLSDALTAPAVPMTRAGNTMTPHVSNIASAIDNAPFRIPIRALLRRVAALSLARADGCDLAASFHAAFAALLVAGCVRAREETHLTTVALSGGVFQNALLTHLVTDALTAQGFTAFAHRRVSANDGGIALGQAVIAAAMHHAPHNNA